MSFLVLSISDSILHYDIMLESTLLKYKELVEYMEQTLINMQFI